MSDKFFLPDRCLSEGRQVRIADAETPRLYGLVRKKKLPMAENLGAARPQTPRCVFHISSIQHDTLESICLSTSVKFVNSLALQHRIRTKGLHKEQKNIL